MHLHNKKMGYFRDSQCNIRTEKNEKNHPSLNKLCKGSYVITSRSRNQLGKINGYLYIFPLKEFMVFFYYEFVVYFVFIHFVLRKLIFDQRMMPRFMKVIRIRSFEIRNCIFKKSNSFSMKILPKLHDTAASN